MVGVDPTNLGFPHAEAVIKVQYESSKSKKTETRYYVSSVPVETYTAKQWLNLTKGHWGGVEIRNHWRKDACLLEDKTRSRNPNMVATFAMLRNTLLFFFKNQQVHSTLTGFVEAVAADKSRAFSMLRRKI